MSFFSYSSGQLLGSRCRRTRSAGLGSTRQVGDWRAVEQPQASRQRAVDREGKHQSPRMDPGIDLVLGARRRSFAGRWSTSREVATLVRNGRVSRESGDFGTEHRVGSVRGRNEICLRAPVPLRSDVRQTESFRVSRAVRRTPGSRRHVSSGGRSESPHNASQPVYFLELTACHTATCQVSVFPGGPRVQLRSSSVLYSRASGSETINLVPFTPAGFAPEVWSATVLSSSPSRLPPCPLASFRGPQPHSLLQLLVSLLSPFHQQILTPYALESNLKCRTPSSRTRTISAGTTTGT